MTEKEIIRAAMKDRGWNQTELAEKAGFPKQSNVTGLLNNNKNGIRIDKFVQLCNGLGLEIVVRDVYNKNADGWVLDMVSAPKAEG